MTAERFPAPGDGRRKLVARLALFCALLLLAVIAASAYLRLAGAGLGCADWPRCYGHPASAAEAGKAGGSMAAVRLIHRISATLALLLVLAMTWLCVLRRPALAREGRLAIMLLALTLGLAALGWATGASTLPAVVLANLLGGFIMLALALRLRDAAAGRGTVDPRGAAGLLRWARLGAALLVAEIVAGGLLSADFAALGCTTLPLCNGEAAHSGEWGAVFNPMRDFAGRPPSSGDAGAVALHLIHRALALASAVVLGAAALRAAAGPAGVAGIAVAALILGEILLGLASVRFGLPLSLVVAHNLLAAALLAATALLLRRLSGQA